MNSFFRKILSVSLFSIAFAFAGTASYAGNSARQDALNIDSAGKQASQAESAEQSRNINDSSWSGANRSTSDSGMSVNSRVGIVGGNAPDSSQTQQPSSFEPSEAEDITPWRTELNAIYGLFAGAMALLGVAALMMNRQAGYPTVEDSVRGAIGMALAATAAAACVAALSLSVIIMIKYKQYVLGGMWAALCTMGIVSGVAAAYAGYNHWRRFDHIMRSFITGYMNYIGLFLMLAGGVAGAAAAGVSEFIINDKHEKQYCAQHADNPKCPGSASTQK